MALDEHHERTIIQQKLAKRLAEDPELKAQFDELARLLSGNGSLRDAGEIIVNRVLQGAATNPAIGTANDGKDVLENEAWRLMSRGWHGESHFRPRNWPIIKQIRRSIIINRLVKSLSDTIQGEDKRIEQADSQTADDGHRTNIRTFIATNAALLGKEKAIERRINALLSARRTSLQAIGTEILESIDHSTPRTGANPTETIVINQVLEKLKLDGNLETAFDGTPESNTLLLDAIRENYQVFEARRNEYASRIKRESRGRVGRTFGLNNRHTRGLQEAKLQGAKTTKLETQRPAKIKPDKFKAAPREKIRLGASGEGHFAERKKAEIGSVLDGVKNTFRLNENERATDEPWKPESGFGKTLYYGPLGIPFAAHRLFRGLRLGGQFLVRNGVVRPLNFIFRKSPKFIWEKGLKKLKTPTVAAGRLIRRGAWLALSTVGLGIPSFIRSKVKLVRPYKVARTGWRKERLARKQQRRN